MASCILCDCDAYVDSEGNLYCPVCQNTLTRDEIEESFDDADPGWADGNHETGLASVCGPDE